MTILAGEYRNTAGSVFRIKNSTLNLSGVSSVIGAAGFSAILVEEGSLLNIVDSGKITAANLPAIHVKNSKVNISNTNQVSSNSGVAIRAEDSNVIISNLNVLSGSVPLTMEGECHVNLNRIRTLNVSGSSENTCIRGTGTRYGSLLVQNINIVDGSIQTTNMNVTLSNVRTVRTSGASAAVSFVVAESEDKDPKGNYTLIVNGPTLISGGTTSLNVLKGIAQLNQVTLEGDSKVTDSVVTLENSYVTSPITITDTTLNSTRTSFDEIAVLNSHIETNNSTIAELTADASSVITHRSLINGNVDGSNRTALWLHNSKVAGTTTLADGSSMVGSAANIVGSITADASFFGSYGGVHGTVTTSNKGASIALGSSGGAVDGKLGGNVVSVLTDTLTIYAKTLLLESVQDTTIKTGTTLSLVVGTNYSNTVTGKYTDSIGTDIKIDAGGKYDLTCTGTYTVVASGVASISGNPTVTI